MVCITLVTSIFFDIYNFINARNAGIIVRTQLVPSFVEFVRSRSSSGYAFILIVIITFAAGRSYCSFLCPLGIYQDIVIRISAGLRGKAGFKYLRAYNFIRYSILVITAAVMIFSGTYLLLWLDPFSIYGRFSYNVLSPCIIKINNMAALLLLKLDNYTLQAVEIKPVGIIPVIISALVITLISVTAFFKGRLYCNTVCPAGALLGLISKISLIKISINRDTCISCGKCEKICKGSCIDYKSGSVDFSRCILCFNCLTVCPNSSTVYRFSIFPGGKNYLSHKINGEISSFSATPVITRKSFIGGMVSLPVAATLPSGKQQKLYFQDAAKQVRYKKKVFASPPGSSGIDRFNGRCTACSLCISKCPSSVLRPAVMQYGIYGMLQPFLDFSSGYCNYDCVICGQICPTGAIVEKTILEKHLIQTGKSFFIKENCITYTNNTVCGACSEHCPTKAVHMVPFKKGLVIPEVDNTLCTGCGACEHVCPVRPFRAIYVEGNMRHETVKLPPKTIIKKETDKRKQTGDLDFPF